MSTNETPKQGPSINVSGITGASVVIGNGNHVVANIHFEQFKDNAEKLDPQLWKDITTKMDELLKAVKSLGDEHEELRDIDLTPAVSGAKKEAAAITIDPKKSKTSFIDRFKSICELAGKTVEVGTKLAPFIIAISKMLGIA